MFDGQEPLKFIAGDTMYTHDDVPFAQIHISGRELWLGRVQIFGQTAEEAEHLRDRLISAWSQPSKPEYWQARHDSHNGGRWYNVGEDWIAKLHGKGFEIRGLYLRAK